VFSETKSHNVLQCNFRLLCLSVLRGARGNPFEFTVQQSGSAIMPECEHHTFCLRGGLSKTVFAPLIK